jgi:hypothetical protein
MNGVPKTTRQDDFPQPIKTLLAHRVGYRCSNPECRVLTVGPQIDNSKTVNIGCASHITAASPGGPRYDPNLTNEQRRAYDNGIWLCASHAKLVDDDKLKYTVVQLLKWKIEAERDSALELERGRELSRGSRSGPFTPRESSEFSFLVENFNHRWIHVPASTGAAKPTPKGYWIVSVTVLELFIWCLRNNSDYFIPWDMIGHEFTATSTADGQELTFWLCNERSFGEWGENLRRELSKFDLVQKNRRLGEYDTFTKRSRRMIYWIEYNDIVVAKPECNYIKIGA